MVGPEGEGWRSAAAEASTRFGIEIDCYGIDHELFEAVGEAPTFCEAYGIGASGPVWFAPTATSPGDRRTLRGCPSWTVCWRRCWHSPGDRGLILG